MKFIFAVAWRNLWRQGRRSLITAGAMSVSVALCMAMLAISDGMFAQFYDVMVVRTLGHVQIHNPDYPAKHQMQLTLQGADALVATLKADPEVSRVTERLYGSALVGTEERSTGAQLLGVVPADELAVTRMEGKVTQGRFLGDQPAGEVVLGKGLAETLKTGVGEQLVVITQASDGSLGNELYTIVGVVSSGRSALDRAGAWVHIEDLRSLLALEGQSHEVLVIGQDIDDLAGLKAVATAAVADQPALVRDWKQADPAIAKMLSMSEASVFVFLFIVFSVAALGVLNTMLMAVFERTRELGVMRALGLRPGQLMSLVLAESAMLGVLACGAGLVLGGLLDAYLVVKGLDFSINGEGISQMGVMLDPVILGVVKPGSVVLTLAMLFAVCVLAGLWPAVRAARLRPVDAMREG